MYYFSELFHLPLQEAATSSFLLILMGSRGKDYSNVEVATPPKTFFFGKTIVHLMIALQ
jgi:hypothetical protein